MRLHQLGNYSTIEKISPQVGKHNNTGLGLEISELKGDIASDVSFLLFAKGYKTTVSLLPMISLCVS
ncbi:hypothetical protein [Pantoea sp. Nvir]|uniref:hypothetical protein n=1 Tax=Pantoea sp. Nvir TaxID=2576760 RepID=UPI00135A969D|nr:hypothetical protein [Pantoea sp. Nvir]CAJ0992756.1 hypothetical protein NVIRPANT_00770 [Pantoea sp. Nvir]